MEVKIQVEVDCVEWHGEGWYEFILRNFCVKIRDLVYLGDQLLYIGVVGT